MRLFGRGGRGWPLWILYFVSGFAALAYQVLWVRELGLLFGSTAQAASLAIAIFFAGIALGGWFWGRRAPTIRNALRGFGFLEIAVAATALGHFVLTDAYHAIYPAMYTAVGHSPTLDGLAKAVVATVVLLPPAFFMGGTFPMMGQHVVRAHDQLGRTGSLLYGVNTAGSATGAFTAGFILPLALGFHGAYLLAVALDLVVGVTAVLLARPPHAASQPPIAPTPTTTAHDADETVRPGPGPPLRRHLVWTTAFASGATALGVEVVWTRLFSQVLQNSAYTYALVLSTFLLALAAGAGLAGALSRWSTRSADGTLSAILVASGAVIAVSPWLFYRVTDGLAYVGGNQDFTGYVLAVTGVAVLVMFIPGTVVGLVLPYLLRGLQDARRAPRETIGRLIAANTAGSILGSLATGFVLMPLLGAWHTVLLLATVYPVLAALVAPFPSTIGRVARAGGTVAACAALAVASTHSAEMLRLNRYDQVLEVREGPGAHAAVVQSGEGSRSLKVNNYYTLGGTSSLDSEQNQTMVPMLAHPEPDDVFFLGLGTGITAGTALSFPVERVVACEILDEVVALSERHFGDYTNGLFDDPRVTVHAEDGRNCLHRSADTYDLIISDLFTPWKAGTGNLYTLEHYETARERLNPGGAYVQWVPLYQVSEREFGIIANTMDAAFDQVVLWRGDLYSSRSVVALVGHPDATTLAPAALVSQGRAVHDDPAMDDDFYESVVLRFYAGNITASGLFADWPLNTDNRPLVEYTAPQTHRMVRSGDASFLVGSHRNALYDALAEQAPPKGDPYLQELTSAQLGYIRAGRDYSTYRLLNHQDRTDDAQPFLDRAMEQSPPSAREARDISPASRLLAPPPDPSPGPPPE